MLVINRKVDESVMIGDDVEMIVISIKDRRVTFGFRTIADGKFIKIFRKEIYDERQRQAIKQK